MIFSIFFIINLIIKKYIYLCKYIYYRILFYHLRHHKINNHLLLNHYRFYRKNDNFYKFYHLQSTHLCMDRCLNQRIDPLCHHKIGINQNWVLRDYMFCNCNDRKPLPKVSLYCPNLRLYLPNLSLSIQTLKNKK